MFSLDFSDQHVYYQSIRFHQVGWARSAPATAGLGGAWGMQGVSAKKYAEPVPGRVQRIFLRMVKAAASCLKELRQGSFNHFEHCASVIGLD